MRRLLWLSATLVTFGLPGCGAPPKPPLVEDAARLVAPVPACMRRLPKRSAAEAGTPRVLDRSTYWSLVYPSFNEPKSTLSADARTCNHDSLFGSPLLAQGKLAMPIGDDKTVLARGPDQLVVVWLKSHAFADGTFGGALALVRAMENHAELYAVGPFRASVVEPKFALERVSDGFVVTVAEDGCVKEAAPPSPRKRGQPAGCTSVGKFFVVRRGRLELAAEIARERTDFREANETGTHGLIEYKLTSRPEFRADGLRVTERLVLKELDSGREVRTSQRERLFNLSSERAVATEPSLWDTVFEAK